VGIGALAAGTPAHAAPAAYEPARHPQDDWMDAIPGKHRVVIDAASAEGAGSAILFANNLYVANQSGYALGDKDVAIMVVLRHFATAFAFTDPIWAKYGAGMNALLKFNDPKTQKAPTTNMYNSADYGMALPSLGNTIDSIVKRGTHFAVCDMATHFMSGQLAGSGGNADAVYKELAASLIPNSHFVAAGVVGVNRAQERGYTLIYAG
jgi:hypothetical protein